MGDLIVGEFDLDQPAGRGYKQSGIGCETHKMMLDYYQQTKNSSGQL